MSSWRVIVVGLAAWFCLTAASTQVSAGGQKMAIIAVFKQQELDWNRGECLRTLCVKQYSNKSAGLSAILRIGVV
jgi:hypothetical protein